MPDNRAKYIATVLQAVILGAVTYYGVKWLVDAMDPTKKNRLAAQKQVGTCLPDTQEAGVNIGVPVVGQYLFSDSWGEDSKSSLFLRYHLPSWV